MTIAPGTPDDWTDTVEPERAAPERILPTPEDVTPSATKVAMVCYAVGAASKCWEHPERAGVFDSDRASQIVTELCVALGMEQQGDTASESARGGCMADFDAPQAPGQGEDSLSPSEPVFIDPATLAPGTAVEIEWPTIRDRFLYYADEGGYQITAGKVGNGDPYPWKDGRIVRVFTEDKPMQEPVLPRPITPEDTPAPASGVGLDLDAAHVRTDPACTFHDGATPKASRGKSCPACMRLDLDALHETICDKFTGMAEVRQAADLLVAEVRRLTEEVGRCRAHDCRPIYSRSVCGQCGGQEQWCETCSRQMCGCATDGQEGDHA